MTSSLSVYFFVYFPVSFLPYLFPLLPHANRDVCFAIIWLVTHVNSPKLNETPQLHIAPYPNISCIAETEETASTYRYMRRMSTRYPSRLAVSSSLNCTRRTICVRLRMERRPVTFPITSLRTKSSVTNCTALIGGTQTTVNLLGSYRLKVDSVCSLI